MTLPSPQVKARANMAAIGRLEFLRSHVCLLDLAGQFTELRPYSGNEYVGLCLFHPESNPSFFVNRDGHFFCHGCGTGGDVFRFVEVLCACDFRDAVRQVARLSKGRPLSLPTPGLSDAVPHRCQGVWGAGSPPGQRAERMRTAREAHRRAVALGAMRSALEEPLAVECAAERAALPEIYTSTNNFQEQERCCGRR